eukprot:1339819-Rhodomonas_salina.2
MPVPDIQGGDVTKKGRGRRGGRDLVGRGALAEEHGGVAHALVLVAHHARLPYNTVHTLSPGRCTPAHAARTTGRCVCCPLHTAHTLDSTWLDGVRVWICTELRGTELVAVQA